MQMGRITGCFDVIICPINNLHAAPFISDLFYVMVITV